MSGFTPLVSETFKFDGDEVKVQFKRLKRKDMISLIPKMSEGGRIEITSEVINQAIDLIPEYVTKFDGLRDANGDVVDLELALDNAYFTKLVSEIALTMVTESVMREGNSESYVEGPAP